MDLKKYIFLFCSLLVTVTSFAGKKSGTQISESEQRKFSYYFYEAVKQRELGNFSEAGDLLQKCIYIKPNDDAILNEMSNLYKAANDTKMAAAFAYLAYESQPKNYWYNLSAADLLFKSNAPEVATDILESTIKNFPKEESSYYALISVYEKSYQLEKAIEVMNKYEKNFGIQEEISIEKYHCYSALNQTDKASKEIDALIAAFPQDSRYLLMRADILYENGETEEALKIFNNVLEKEPENGIVLLALAKHYETNGDNEKSTELIDRALRSPSVEFETKVEILGEYLKSVQGKDEWKNRVFTLFEALEDMYPDIADVHYYFATYYVSIHNIDAAVEQLQKAIELVPDDKDFYYITIELLSTEKRKECLDFIATAKTRFPDDAKLYHYEANIYFLDKKYEKAESVLNDGIRIATEQKDAQTSSMLYGTLGDLYNEQHRQAEAFDAYEKGLTFSSTNTLILNNYSYYLAEANQDLEKAEKMINLCLKLEPSNINAIDTYAWILFKQGYYHLAKQNLDKVLNANYSNETMQIIWEHYGDILSKAGDIDNAVKAWKKSVELGNKNEIINKKIESKIYVEVE